MLEVQLAELEAKEKAATPGPWMPSAECESIIAAEDSIYGLGVADCDAERLNGSSGRPWREEQPNNIAIITTFRNAAPQFIMLAKNGVELRTCFMAGDDPQLLVKLLGQQFTILDEISAALPSVK